MGTPERDLHGSSVWREGAGRLPGSRELELEQGTPPHPQKGPQALAEGQSHCFRRPGKDREMGRDRETGRDRDREAETETKR